MSKCKYDKESKRLPYGAKGNDYCVCDTHHVIVASKGAEREKAKREILKERKRIRK